MYDLVIIWTLAFTVLNPAGNSLGKSTQGTMVVDRVLKSSKATCEADLKKASQKNGQFFTSGLPLFVKGYCARH